MAYIFTGNSAYLGSHSIKVSVTVGSKLFAENRFTKSTTFSVRIVDINEEEIKDDKATLDLSLA